MDLGVCSLLLNKVIEWKKLLYYYKKKLYIPNQKLLDFILHNIISSQYDDWNKSLYTKWVMYNLEQSNVIYIIP